MLTIIDRIGAMRIRVLLIFLLLSKIFYSQSFCGTLNFENPDRINLKEVAFTRQDNMIDSVAYNCIAVCKETGAKIYGNIDKKGRKDGRFLIYKQNGDFFALGEFAGNKKSGWWWYGGCCRTLFKKGREVRTICALF